MNQRTFGVEIECDSNGFGYEATARLLEVCGFPEWAENLDEDGSELEIRSPILKGVSGLTELKKVFDLLNKFEFGVTEEDGMHVHHGADDLDISQIINIAESWHENQDLIFQMVDRNRWNHYYCPALTVGDLKSLYEERGDKLEDDDEYNYYNDGERTCINFHSRHNHGTIEIRLHEGTLDFEKAKAWVLFGQSFISNVARRKRPIPTQLTVGDILKKTRTDKVVIPTLLKRVDRRVR